MFVPVAPLAHTYTYNIRYTYPIRHFIFPKRRQNIHLKTPIDINIYIIIITMYDACVTMHDGRSSEIMKYYYLLYYYITHVVHASFVLIGRSAAVTYYVLLLLYD